MKKLLSLVGILLFSTGLSAEEIPKTTPKVVRADRYIQPEENVNICQNMQIPDEMNTVAVTGKFNDQVVNFSCSQKELKYYYYYDYVKFRGSYEIRCRKLGYYLSINIRNPVEGKLSRPNFPFGDVPTTFTFLLEQGKEKLSQNDRSRNPEHNIESRMFITQLGYDVVKNAKGEGEDLIKGCMDFKFAKEYNGLVAGDINVVFNTQILAPRKKFDGR